MKNCDNCYWKDYKGKHCVYQEVKPEENVCEEHSYKCQCGDDEAVVKYDGVPYCQECLFKSLEIEESTTTQYWWDGEYIGSDDDTDKVMENIISELGNGEVERLDQSQPKQIAIKGAHNESKADTNITALSALRKNIKKCSNHTAEKIRI